MNQVAKFEQPSKLLLMDFMADKYCLKVEEFSRTVRAVCGLPKASPEEFAAFLLVAKEYDLNPLTKEIYAFPAKGGGIVPIVSIDGWVNLINSHGALNGIEFEERHDDKGELIATTCIISRKDRQKPIAITEYLEECRRGTEPWKMKHRMLRHKALIQCARYAFGFSGIYDEDEGAKIADMRDVTPRDEPPTPPPVAADNIKLINGEIIDANNPAATMANDDPVNPVAPDHTKDLEGFKDFLSAQFKSAEYAEELNDLWVRYVEPIESSLFPPDQEDLMGAYRARERELS